MTQNAWIRSMVGNWVGSYTITKLDGMCVYLLIIDVKTGSVIVCRRSLGWHYPNGVTAAVSSFMSQHSVANYVRMTPSTIKKILKKHGHEGRWFAWNY